MPLPTGPAPWFGLSQETLRRLEIHPARAIAIPGRGWRDLGDAVMLFSAGEKEPFFNRLTAVRWPDEPRAFDARLRQTAELFAALDRKPYVWAIPGLSTPVDLIGRLAANGFVDQGGGFEMILVRDPNDRPDVALPRGAVLERWNCPSPQDRPGLARALALVIGESFHIPDSRRHNLVAEIALTLEQPKFHACLLRVDGEPVATGERYSFDGASYLSSIGTRPGWRGLGFGGLITQALARDSMADGFDLVYLGVHAENAPAMRLYERLGFATLGPRSADMLLEHPR
ncbi:MAG: GNAT family N-acetyltransferase [Candidatus Limnocylindrales bacterium]